MAATNSVRESVARYLVRAFGDCLNASNIYWFRLGVGENEYLEGLYTSNPTLNDRG
jgi:hypothetical protein